MKISLRRRHALTVADGAFSHKIDYLLGYSKSRRASKSHNRFKCYGGFAEWVNFAYWWSFIGKGPRVACNAGLFQYDSTTTVQLHIPGSSTDFILIFFVSLCSKVVFFGLERQIVQNHVFRFVMPVELSFCVVN